MTGPINAPPPGGPGRDHTGFPTSHQTEHTDVGAPSSVPSKADDRPAAGADPGRHRSDGGRP